MSLRIGNNFGLYSGGSGGGGGGVIYVGAIGSNGISVSGSPIITCGTLGITNTAPYEGQAIEVLGSGTCSTLRCCVNNSASGNYSASLGGSFNCSSATNSVVVGGIGNNAIGDKSFIGGGCYNCTSGTNSVIGGGVCNFLKNTNGAIDVIGSVVGGGVGNNTSGGTWSGTSFSSQPTPSNSVCFTFIGGGFQNASKGCYSTIGGGQQNIAIGDGSTILGGNLNCSVNDYTTIGGGQQNKSCGVGSTIVGGRLNTIKSDDGVILGGCLNISDGNASVIGGGAINCVCDDNSYIGGGCKNQINSSGESNTIGGGFFNRVCNSSNNSFIGGGVANRTSDDKSSVVGGVMNVVGVSTLYNIQSTNSTSQIIFFNGDVTSQISVNDCVYYYHPQDKVVYSGDATSITYCSALGLTAICGAQLSAGTTNATTTYGRDNTKETTSDSTNNQIEGGFSNTLIGGQNNVILNGEANCMCQVNQSTILNGVCNYIFNSNKDIITNSNSIHNGNKNIITNDNGSYNTIVNGDFNKIIGCCACYGFIGNGQQNLIGCCNSYGLVLNGCSNKLSGNYAFIGNGIFNNLYDVCNDGVNPYNNFGSVIVNGVGNNTTGGTWNDTTKQFDVSPTLLQGGLFTFIGNGFQNYVSGNYSSIINGCLNAIANNSTSTIIGGGLSNTIDSSDYSGIVIGSYHQIIGGSSNSFIGGGSSNQISGGVGNSINSVIGGGTNNIITDSSYNGFIGGGNGNCICCSESSVIGGGSQNCIASMCSPNLQLSSNSILGGKCNCICDCSYSVIVSGCCNTIDSQYSTIIGGINNQTCTFQEVFILGSNICASRNCATYVNNLNITDTPTINNSVDTLGWDSASCEVVLKTIGVGVSSVGLSMPPAFTVLNSPITTSGNICVVGAGLVSQYVRGDGNLATFPVVSGGGGGSVYYLNTTICSCAALGLNQMSRNAVFPSLTNIFTNTSVVDGSPFIKFITDSNDPNLTQFPGGIWEYTAFLSVSASNTATVRADVYKYCTNNGLFTNLGVGAPLTLVDGSTISLYTFSTAIPTTTLATNDRISIYFVGGNSSGNTICLTTSASRLAAVTTTFTSGIGSVNGLSASSQFFTTTTDCSDFCITSSECTHCFNLPCASATKRGLLSTNDWNTFNNKQSTSFPANTFYVNPTTSTATATPALYCESGELALPPSCICQTGTGTPYTCTTGSFNYRYTKIGNLVNLAIYMCFSGNAGVGGISGIEARFPPIPTPSLPFGCTAAGTTLSVASPIFNNTTSFGGGIVRAGLVISSSSSSVYSMCWVLPSALAACRVYYANVSYIASSIS